MSEPIEQRLRRQAQQARRCEVRGCAGRPRLGRYCPRHADNLKSTGNVKAANITVHEMRPWRAYCRAFVDEQHTRGHPGVVAACEWIAARMKAAQAPYRMHRNTPPAIRWAAWLAKMRVEAVQPADVLAAGIACHLHREVNGGSWPDDRYFQHQLGRHILSLAGRRRVKSGKYARDGSPCNTAPMSKPSGVVLLAADEVTKALGALMAAAARHLHGRLTKPEAGGPVEGQYAPFLPASAQRRQTETIGTP